MKRSVWVFSVLPALAFAQPRTSVEALPNGTTPSAGDYTICDQLPGNTNKCTMAQLATYMSGAVNALNPSQITPQFPATMLNATNCTGSTASTVIATTTPCAGALNLEGGVAADGESSLYLTGTVIPTGVKGFGINVSAAFAPSTTTTQNIEGINVEPILDNAAGPITTITGVSTLAGINADYTQTTPVSIDYFSACGYWSDLRSNALTSAPPLNACFLGQPVLIGNGITSGSVVNIQFYAPASISGLVTSAAALGGTMYNYAFRATVPTGSGAGTNSNYGLYISGNGGTGGTGTTVNWAIDSVSTANSQITGGLNNTPIGALTPSTGAFTTLNLPQTTPVNSSAACAVGNIYADANYVYVCTATNTWKRSALNSF